jgi:heme o synthase
LSKAPTCAYYRHHLSQTCFIPHPGFRLSTSMRIAGQEALGFASDIISLTKPKITLMALLLAIAGLLHAQEQPSLMTPTVALSLLGIALLVSGSSALNMYLERDLDRRMLRTKNRPLPAGRIHVGWAVSVGAFSALFACLLLIKASNWLTAIAGIVSLGLYVWCYTPLKQKSWISLLVGSVPGAMPVVLGYLSWSGHMDAKALALFMWAFLWQIPHFLAISIFREDEYTKAGFPVMPAHFGVPFTRRMIVITTWLLVLSTFGLYLSEVINFWLFLIALMLGAWFLWICHHGFFKENAHDWAKRAFRASLVYQSLLFLLLIYGGLNP